MEVTYELNETEFDQKIFRSIKAAFKNRLMRISISSQNGNLAAESEQGYAVSIPYQDFSKIVDSFEEDESYDLMGNLEKFKVKSK